MRKRIFNTEVSRAEINVSLLILRVTMGAMMLTHGWPKFQKILNGDWTFGNPLGLGVEVSLVLAVLGEFVGSIMVIVGFGTRIGAFLLASTMAVAGFIAHDEDPFGRKEKALMYLVVFIVLLITGGGKYALDRKLD